MYFLRRDHKFHQLMGRPSGVVSMTHQVARGQHGSTVILYYTTTNNLNDPTYRQLRCDYTRPRRADGRFSRPGSPVGSRPWIHRQGLTKYNSDSLSYRMLHVG